jgi:hypothetical protein
LKQNKRLIRKSGASADKPLVKTCAEILGEQQKLIND